MKKLLGSLALLMIGAGIWRLTERLSPDALGMALGVLFGVLAGLPVTLLVLAAQRRPSPPRIEPRPDPYHHTPPVIVLTGGNHYVPNQNRPKAQHVPLLPGQRRANVARPVVSDSDDGEDW